MCRDGRSGRLKDSNGPSQILKVSLKKLNRLKEFLDCLSEDISDQQFNRFGLRCGSNRFHGQKVLFGVDRLLSGTITTRSCRSSTCSDESHRCNYSDYWCPD